MKSSRILLANEGTRVVLPKAVMTIKADSTGGDNAGYVFGELVAEPGFAGPGLHAHEHHEEIFYIVEGQFDWSIDGETRRCGAGTTIRIPPGVVHNFGNPTDETARILVHGAPEELEHYRL